MVSTTKDGKILYRAGKTECIPFPKTGDKNLSPGMRCNYEIYDPLDFLAEITQHIPNTVQKLQKKWRRMAFKVFTQQNEVITTGDGGEDKKADCVCAAWNAGTEYYIPSQMSHDACAELCRSMDGAYQVCL
jgi:hypothetical protein